METEPDMHAMNAISAGTNPAGGTRGHDVRPVGSSPELEILIRVAHF